MTNRRVDRILEDEISNAPPGVISIGSSIDMTVGNSQRGNSRDFKNLEGGRHCVAHVTRCDAVDDKHCADMTRYDDADADDDDDVADAIHSFINDSSHEDVNKMNATSRCHDFMNEVRCGVTYATQRDTVDDSFYDIPCGDENAATALHSNSICSNSSLSTRLINSIDQSFYSSLSSVCSSLSSSSSFFSSTCSSAPPRQRRCPLSKAPPQVSPSSSSSKSFVATSPKHGQSFISTSPSSTSTSFSSISASSQTSSFLTSSDVPSLKSRHPHLHPHPHPPSRPLCHRRMRPASASSTSSSSMSATWLTRMLLLLPLLLLSTLSSTTWAYPRWKDGLKRWILVEENKPRGTVVYTIQGDYPAKPNAVLDLTLETDVG